MPIRVICCAQFWLIHVLKWEKCLKWNPVWNAPPCRRALHPARLKAQLQCCRKSFTSAPTRCPRYRGAASWSFNPQSTPETDLDPPAQGGPDAGSARGGTLLHASSQLHTSQRQSSAHPPVLRAAPGSAAARTPVCQENAAHRVVRRGSHQAPHQEPHRCGGARLEATIRVSRNWPAIGQKA